MQVEVRRFLAYNVLIVLGIMPTIEGKKTFFNYTMNVSGFINGSCFILLISSLVAIKNKKVELHKKLNTTAMLLSVVFLWR